MKKKQSKAERERIAKNAGVPLLQGVAYLNGGSQRRPVLSPLVAALRGAK